MYTSASVLLSLYRVSMYAHLYTSISVLLSICLLPIAYHGAVDEPGDGDRRSEHPGHVPDHDAPEEL